MATHDASLSLSTLRRLIFPKLRLHELPTDILLEVFKNAPTFPDVQALVLTSRVFYTVWQAHAWIIYGEVLPRSILCYPQAQALVDCQKDEEIAMAEKFQCDRRKCRNWLLSTNAGVVAAARDLFNSQSRSSPVARGQPKRQIIQISESARFHHAFYRLWAFALVPETRGDASFRHMTFHQLYPLHELSEWIFFLRSDDLLLFRALFRHSTMPDWDACCKAVNELWMAFLKTDRRLGNQCSRRLFVASIGSRWSSFCDLDQEYFMNLPHDTTQMTSRFGRTALNVITSGGPATPHGHPALALVSSNPQLLQGHQRLPRSGW